jgi:RNA polymerase sigma factor (sigma-70 family)
MRKRHVNVGSGEVTADDENLGFRGSTVRPEVLPERTHSGPAGTVAGRMGIAPKRAKESVEAQWSDSRLVRECLNGKESAWSTLIDRYKNLIFSIPVKFGFSQEDSADIFQAVCMDLLADLSRIREPEALAAWLIQVTRNKCFHRKQEQQRQPTEEIDQHALPAPDAPVEQVLTQVEQEQALRSMLLELSPRCRQLVQLLFFEVPARPYEVVAKELGLSTGSIGLIRRRCLEQLRRRLEA